jgi:hypothetical protein
MTSNQYDAIIIGGWHNGLVAAAIRYDLASLD